jgi:hypothetical protein
LAMGKAEFATLFGCEEVLHPSHHSDLVRHVN